MSPAKRFILLAVSLLLCAGLLTAQVTNAKIFGVVQLEDGSLVPGVAVEATSPKLVGKAIAVTDENGTFRLLSLTPGSYKLVFTLQGFQTVVRENVLLALEQTLNLKITMKLGNIEEMVTITGQLPLIDVKSTAKGMTLTKEVFQTLPKGRDFSTLVTAIPGVSNEPISAGISVDGASGGENMFYTDGMETSDLRGGTQRMMVAFDFVDEVQVKASGYQAEFGGSLGGVINVVTRSGGNEFHGEVMGYYRGSALAGKTRDVLRLNPDNPEIAEYVNYEDLYSKDRYTRLEGGFNLGGYVIKDKLWFFGSFLPVQIDSDRDVFWDGEGTTPTVYNQKDTSINFQVKLTAQPTKNLRMSGSFVNNNNKWRGALPARDGSSNIDAEWAGDGRNLPTWSASGNLDYTIGNNLLISARGGHFFENTQAILDPPGGFIYHRYYVPAASIGWPASATKPNYWSNYDWGGFYKMSGVQYERNSANLDANFFVRLAGEHSWKAGFQFVQLVDNVDKASTVPVVILRIGRKFPYEIPGSPVPLNYLGKYGYYEVRDPFGVQVKDAKSDRMALYLQDSWTISDRFTVNLGLRAETEKIPLFSDDPEVRKIIPYNLGWGDKLAPRLGFIYDVMGDSSLKVFGSFGIFHDVMKLALPEGSWGADKWVSTYYELDTFNWEAINAVPLGGTFPGTKWGAIDWRIPSSADTDPDIKPMSMQEISFGAEKKINENLQFSVRVVNKKLLRAIEDIGVKIGGSEHYYISNPGSDYINEKFAESVLLGYLPEGLPLQPKPKRDYWAVNIGLEKRFSDNWLAGVNYTWSRLTGNYAGLNSTDEPGRTDPNVSRYWDLWFQQFDQDLNPIDGVLPTDRTHFLKAYGSYVFPFGLTLGTVINAYSGLPHSTEVLMNNQQGYYPLGRNDTGLRSPFTFKADFFAEYMLKLGKNYVSFSLNVTNITDSKTAQRLFTIYNQDDVGITDEDLLLKPDVISQVDITDPRYKKELTLLAPWQATLGVKFGF